MHLFFLLKKVKKEWHECVLVTDRLTWKQNENLNELKEKVQILFSFYFQYFLIDA